MRSSVARRLLRLNRAFYDAFAPEFAASRRSLSPGIRRALAALGSPRALLDLGCGDGRVGRAWLGRRPAGARPRYRGIDGSRALLELAAAGGPGRAGGGPDGAAGAARRAAVDARYLAADLALPGWSRHPGLAPGGFDAAVCFAVLFHLPGPRRRLRLLREARALLAGGGRLVVSVWQLLHVPRLRRKIVPWESIGLAGREVDAGDLLVDWRQGGRGVRYVHHFEPDELRALCRRAGFEVLDTYRSDGVTGDLGLYLVLRGPPRRPLRRRSARRAAKTCASSNAGIL